MNTQKLQAFVAMWALAPTGSMASSDFERIQSVIADAGGVGNIALPEGRFVLDRGLVLEASNVNLKGAGVDKTILDFSDQIDGSPGLSIVGRNVTLSDMTILNSAGDGVRAAHSEKIHILRLKVGWTEPQGNLRGNYGIYPVSSSDVTIADCEAFGALEAGIYVGQSVNSQIYNNIVHSNTVGIESENSVDSTIERNSIYNNSIGVLVSDVPGLPVFAGATRIAANTIERNNAINQLRNASHLSFGQRGLGVLLVAAKHTVIAENRISNHQVSHVALIGYGSTNFSRGRVLFDPNLRGVKVGINSYSNESIPVKVGSVSFYSWQFDGGRASIIWDGRIEKTKLYKEMPREKHFCISDGAGKVMILPAANGDAMSRTFLEGEIPCS